MLKITFLEFIMRGIPEGLIFALVAYTMTKNRIDLKRYLISAMILSVTVYIIRFFPIQSGVDSILNLIILIAVLININKFEVIQSVKAAIIAMLCEFVFEGLNVVFLQIVLKKDLNLLFMNPISKLIYSSPSLIFFAIITIVSYIRMLKGKRRLMYYGEDN